jgi:integrase
LATRTNKNLNPNKQIIAGTKMKLTELKIKNSKAKEKAYQIADGHGLTLYVMPNGAKRWRFRYRIEGTAKMISFGLYPDVPLKFAREKLLKVRQQLAKGIDPSEKRKAEKETSTDENTFEAVAKEWWERNKGKWTENHGYQIYRRLKLNVFPWLGNKQISKITAPEVLKVLRRIEERNAVDMAHRVKGNIAQVMRYAVATSRVERDVTYDLKDALTPAKHKHYACITDPIQFGGLLRAINEYEGHFSTKCALRLSPLVFLRPGEVRNAEWSEIDFETKEWRIPADKMKKGRLHIIPLSNQAIEIFKEIQPLTGHGKYIFPSVKSSIRPMSNNTINGALRRLGYTKEEMTAHGFRGSASTMLNELGYNFDHIERQLAHAEQVACVWKSY